MSLIPYGRQAISDEDIAEVTSVLRSDFLTQGPAVPSFEQAVSRKVGAEFAVAMNSATSALHVACLALGVGPGDWVWTSPISFVASSNCALYCGADVDFVDIDPDTYNMSVNALEEKLRVAEMNGQLPKVVIPVHLCGQSCDMESIHRLSSRYGFKIIEDASHAIGGTYQSKAIGACQYSDIAIFSFHPVKIITTAEGGMALTNNPQLARAMQLLRSHGITRESSEMTQSPDGPWYYQQIALGFNYRMTDLQAALGLSQLQKLDAFIGARRQIASVYDQALSDIHVKIPKQDNQGESAWHLYVIRTQQSCHNSVFEQLRANNIGVNLHYIPIYQQPYYRQKYGYPDGYCPQAEQYYHEAISIPMFATLSTVDQSRVIEAVRQAVER